MNIDNLTIKQARELAAMFGAVTPQLSRRAPIPIGSKVFIRTVTHHYTGRVVECFEEDIVLDDAAWIADDGRFETAVKEGKFNEVEPYPSGRRPILNRGSFLECVIVDWELPRSQK